MRPRDRRDNSPILTQPGGSRMSAGLRVAKAWHSVRQSVSGNPTSHATNATETTPPRDHPATKPSHLRVSPME